MVPPLLLDLALLAVVILAPLLTALSSPYFHLMLVSGVWVLWIGWLWRRLCAPLPAPLPEALPSLWMVVLAGLAGCHLLPWFTLPDVVETWWKKYINKTAYYASVEQEQTLVWGLSLLAALGLFLMARDRLRDIPRRHRLVMVMLSTLLLASLNEGEGKLLAGGAALALGLVVWEGRRRAGLPLAWDLPLGPDLPSLGVVSVLGGLGVLLLGWGGDFGVLPFWGVGLVVGLCQLSPRATIRRLGLLLPLLCLLSPPPQLPPGLLGWGPGVQGDILWQGLNLELPRGLWALMGSLGAVGAGVTLVLYGLFVLPFWQHRSPPRPTTWGVPALMTLGATVTAAGFWGGISLATPSLLILAVVAGASLAALREEGGAPFEPSLIWGSLPRTAPLVLVGLSAPLGLLGALLGMKVALADQFGPYPVGVDQPTLNRALQFWPWSREAAEGLARLESTCPPPLHPSDRQGGVNTLLHLRPTSAPALLAASSEWLCRGDSDKSGHLVELAARLYPQDLEVQVAWVEQGWRTEPAEGVQRLVAVGQRAPPWWTPVVERFCSRAVEVWADLPSPPSGDGLALALWRCSADEGSLRCPLIGESLKDNQLTSEDVTAMWEVQGCDPGLRQIILDAWRRLEPTSDQVLRRQFELWLELGQVEQVRQQVTALMEVSTPNRQWLALGIRATLTSGVPPPWRSLLESELGRDPSWVEGWEVAAQLAATTGNRGARRAALEQLVALRPKDVKYQVGMAELDAELGLDKRAEERLKVCISQLTPASPCLLSLSLYYLKRGEMEHMSQVLEMGHMLPEDMQIFRSKACNPVGPLTCGP